MANISITVQDNKILIDILDGDVAINNHHQIAQQPIEYQYNEHGEKLATDKQRRILESAGLWEDGTTAAEAWTLVNEIMEKRKRDKAAKEAAAEEPESKIEPASDMPF